MTADRSRQPAGPDPVYYTRLRLFPRSVVIGLAGAVLLSIALHSGRAPCRAQERVATPQRPSISFGTGTVPDDMWELEAGGLLARGGSAIPLFLKYGLTDRTEFEVGIDAVRQIEQPDGIRSSMGDLFLGVRSRRSLRQGRSAAIVGWLLVPTAVEGVGSTHYDAGAVGVLSLPLGGLTLDTNLWLVGIGRDEGTIVGRVQAVANLGIPLRGCWSSFAELSLQRTAGTGSGGFIDAGVACAASRTSVFDLAVGAGWDRGFPEWTVNVGWTRLFDRE